MKKYELTDETKIVNVRTLHRIRALRSFGYVEEGGFGGWIENEENLSHEGNCWVFQDAKVYDDAQVFGSARVYGGARISGNARVYGNALVYDSACIIEDAIIRENANVSENAYVWGNAQVYGKAQVYGWTLVYGNARVCGYAGVYGLSCLSGDIILKFSEPTQLRDFKLDHGTWEDVIKINDKKYLVSNMLDLYEVPG